MTERNPDDGGEKTFREELIAHGLLIPTGVDGVYGRGREYERVIEGFDRLLTASTENDGAEMIRFPPVLNRRDFERSGYLKSFPHLAGSIFSFEDGQAEHKSMIERIDQKGDWSEFQTMTDVVMAPAACYPLYPMVSGALPRLGRFFDVSSYCFRHEPSGDPARMQMFRMREFVRVGEQDAVQAWRDDWVERGRRILASLGLGDAMIPATDPFFGRGGKFLAMDQIENKLKYELIVPIASAEKPTAVMSINYHQDHFGVLFEIRTSAGAVAHSACLAFGMDRIALALFKTHGFSTAGWKDSVRKKLWPERA